MEPSIYYPWWSGTSGTKNEVDKWTDDDESGDLVIPIHVAHREVGQDLSSSAGPQNISQPSPYVTSGLKRSESAKGNIEQRDDSSFRTQDTLGYIGSSRDDPAPTGTTTGVSQWWRAKMSRKVSIKITFSINGGWVLTNPIAFQVRWIRERRPE